jgi:hypothetical protein
MSGAAKFLILVSPKAGTPRFIPMGLTSWVLCYEGIFIVAKHFIKGKARAKRGREKN